MDNSEGSNLWDISRNLYNEGFVALEEKDFEAAIQYLTESIKLYPHYATHFRLYQALEMLNRLEDAEYHLSKAYLLNPNNDKVGTQYAKTLMNKGEVAKAKSTLESILIRNKTYSPAKRLLEEINDLNSLN